MLMFCCCGVVGGGDGGGGGFVVFWNSQVCVVNAVCCQKNVGLEYVWQKPFGVKGLW